jgi:hypothetical protein
MRQTKISETKPNDVREIENFLGSLRAQSKEIYCIKNSEKNNLYKKISNEKIIFSQIETND